MSASTELTSSECYSVKKAAAVAKVQGLLGREVVMQNVLGVVMWKVVAELTPSIPPPKCLKLSVNDYTFDHESKTLFASLFLHLMCGNWQEKVQLLNNAIHEYNCGVG